MDPGALDRRITLKRASTTTNGFNEPIYTWATLATVWAAVTPVMDGERLRAGETIAMKQSRFTIRWSSTVSSLDPRDRLTFDGHEYDVNGVKQIGRRQFLEITATARAEASA